MPSPSASREEEAGETGVSPVVVVAEPSESQPPLSDPFRGIIVTRLRIGDKSAEEVAAVRAEVANRREEEADDPQLNTTVRHLSQP
eukprot:598547-Prorocentrum_minimum.AAC.1